MNTLRYKFVAASTENAPWISHDLVAISEKGVGPGMDAPIETRVNVNAVERELGPVVSFLRVVWALDRALTRKSKQMHRVLGVTGTQRFVLRLVAQQPGLSAGELARLLHLDPSTLTGVLARLTGRGALERLPDAGDGRRALFRISGPGQALAKKRVGTVEACAWEALSRVPPEDVRATVRVLTTMIEALEQGDR